jgi:hypothetical protein
MNPKYINNRFAQEELISVPKMVEWKDLEFFVFGTFLIKEGRHNDAKYQTILEAIARSEFELGAQDASKLVARYIAEILREEDALAKFNRKHSGQTTIAKSFDLYTHYGLEGMKLLAERKFTSRPVHVVQKLIETYTTTQIKVTPNLSTRFDALSSNRVFAEMGLLVAKKRTLFGSVLSKDVMFFLWFLYMALDPEDYAVRYLSTKQVEDLERTYQAYIRSNGSVHQTMVKLTREVKEGLRRFD